MPQRPQGRGGGAGSPARSVSDFPPNRNRGHSQAHLARRAASKSISATCGRPATSAANRSPSTRSLSWRWRVAASGMSIGGTVSSSLWTPPSPKPPPTTKASSRPVCRRYQGRHWREHGTGQPRDPGVPRLCFRPLFNSSRCPVLMSVVHRH